MSGLGKGEVAQKSRTSSGAATADDRVDVVFAVVATVGDAVIVVLPRILYLVVDSLWSDSLLHGEGSNRGGRWMSTQRPVAGQRSSCKGTRRAAGTSSGGWWSGVIGVVGSSPRASIDHCSSDVGRKRWMAGCG